MTATRCDRFAQILERKGYFTKVFDEEKAVCGVDFYRKSTQKTFSSFMKNYGSVTFSRKTGELFESDLPIPEMKVKDFVKEIEKKFLCIYDTHKHASIVHVHLGCTSVELSEFARLISKFQKRSSK